VIVYFCANDLLMSTRLVVDNHNELKESRLSDNPPQPLAVRQVATVISYLFHPVFLAIYVVSFLVFLHPYLFLTFTPFRKTLVLLQAAAMYSFFPIVTMLLLKALDFIPSIHLNTPKERIIPLAACMIWYFWIWWVWHNLPDYPREVKLFAMAVFVASVMAWMMNIYMKVSLHAISAGVMVAFMLQMGITQPLNLALYISIALLIAGLVCTARFIVSDHTQKEVYGGLAAGVAALVAANWLV
jgi:hypothetical protein